MMGSNDINYTHSKSSTANSLEKSRAAVSKIHQFRIVLHTAGLIAQHTVYVTVARGLNTNRNIKTGKKC
jgi:hypothetical protein